MKFKRGDIVRPIPRSNVAQLYGRVLVAPADDFTHSNIVVAWSLGARSYDLAELLEKVPKKMYTLLELTHPTLFGRWWE